MRLAVLTAALLLLGCGKGGNSNQQNLAAAANQSTPDAAQVLNGAAQNGMDQNDALNEAAAAQASNTSRSERPRLQARPNSPANPSPRHAGQPPDKVVVNGG
jgi:16S rRNA G1207 methylase RsmC